MARYFILAGLCAALVGTFLARRDVGGAVTNREQAEKDPTFRRGGRIPLLPFRDPFVTVARASRLPFVQKGDTPVDATARRYEKLKEAGPLIFFVFLLALVALGLSPPPFGALALFIGACSLYLLARIFAFKLYIPGRYLQYGAPAATIALATQVVGGLRLPPRLDLWLLRLRKARKRDKKKTGKGDETSKHVPRPHAVATWQNLAALVFVGLVLALTGTGVKEDTGMSLDRRKRQKLYLMMQRLPHDARVAAHPKDADDLPFWAARATTGGSETAHPWYQRSWKKQKSRFRDIFRLLYATKADTLFRLAHRYEITHLFVHRGRYGRRFRRHARFFEPIGAFVRKLLRGVKHTDLVLYKPPPESIIMRYGPYVVLDVARLKKALDRRPTTRSRPRANARARQESSKP